MIPILHNESLFYPFILLMLFSDVSDAELQNCTELQNLSQHYSTIIQRKLLYNNGKFRENNALTNKTGTGNADYHESSRNNEAKSELDLIREEIEGGHSFGLAQSGKLNVTYIINIVY